MNMTTAIEKLDELLAKIRTQIIEKKGLKEEPIEQPEPVDEQTEPTEELPQHPDTDYLQTSIHRCITFFNQVNQ